MSAFAMQVVNLSASAPFRNHSVSVRRSFCGGCATLACARPLDSSDRRGGEREKDGGGRARPAT